MSSQTPSILVINQYYAPDTAGSGRLMAEFCEGMVRTNARVRVITGEPSYSESSPDAPLFEVLNGVEVTRVKMGSARGRTKLRRRLLGYYRFMMGARRVSKQLAEIEKPDLVVTFSNPPFVGLIGAHLASKFDVPFVYVLHDLYPNLLSESGRMRLPWPVPELWRRINRRIFNGASAIIVLGHEIKRTLIERNSVSAEKIRIVDNWAIPEIQIPKVSTTRREFGIPESELVIAYTGNIGIIHNTGVLIDVAERTAKLPVTYMIIGEGQQEAELKKRVEATKITNIKFLDFQPVHKFQELLAAIDICFVGLKRGLEKYSVPSKAYTYMAAGKPVLCAMVPQADIARVIEKYQCGWVAESADNLAQLVRELIASPEKVKSAGERSKNAYRQDLSRDVAVEKYRAIFMQVIAEAGR